MRLSTFFLLISSAIQAATVTSITMNLGPLTGSSSPLQTGGTPFFLDTSGWSVLGSLQLNQSTGNAVNLPVTLVFTNAIIECTFANGCDSSGLGFNATIGFSDNFSGITPYSVSIEGTGPSTNMFFQLNSGSGFAIFSAGNYLFIENGSWDAGAGQNSLTIEGTVGLPSAAFGERITLPNSFDITASPTFPNPVPEPSTAGLAILGSLGLAWASRRSQR